MADLSEHDIGRYHIIEQLGQGGMATVYKAYDARLERDVAIKVIRMDIFGSAVAGEMLKRFEREAKSLARLEHPNIIPIFDYGEYEGSPYLVMRYIPGGTLKSQIGRPVPYLEVCRFLIPIAHALAYAHSQNVIHRDIKPANILITATDQPMLSDFGVAKILEGPEGDTLTGAGVGIGTPEYMAPEQWENQISPTVDVYALGVVFYELITGRKPYTADTPAAIHRKQLMDPLPRPAQFVPGLPEAVEQVIYKVLARDRANRYINMGQFAAALEKLTIQEERIQPSTPVVSENPTEIVAARVPAQSVEPTRVVEHLALSAEQSEVSVSNGNLTGRKRLPGSFIGLGILLAGGALLALLIGGIWLVGKMTASASTQAPTEPTASLPAAMVNQEPTLTLTILPSTTEMNTITATVPMPTDIAPTEAPGIWSFQISNQDGMKLLYVPEGSFQMGSNNGDGGEMPVHTVTLDAFWIDQTEVTNAMYFKCVGAGICQPRKCDSNFLRDQQPAVCVDWEQAKAYCEWAGRRLPTEAEWEKAARGTDSRSYPWGNVQPPDKTLLNYSNYVGITSDVGSYPAGASPYGALDMAGNVWEWVADWADNNYYQNSPDQNPTGPNSGQLKVLRGGAWDNDGYESRSTYRQGEDPTSQKIQYGFRCAMSAIP